MISKVNVTKTHEKMQSVLIDKLQAVIDTCVYKVRQPLSFDSQREGAEEVVRASQHVITGTARIFNLNISQGPRVQAPTCALDLSLVHTATEV